MRTELLIAVLISALPLMGQQEASTTSNGEHRLETVHPESMQLLLDYLDRTEAQLVETLDSMSEDQMAYKPTPNSWSADQILQHILLAERAVYAQIERALATKSDEYESLKHNDAWLIAKVNDRGTKVETPLPLGASKASVEEMVQDFSASRNAIRTFLAQPDLPLRAHYGVSPYGKADCYQLFLVIAAHSMRHHHQILENLRLFPAHP